VTKLGKVGVLKSLLDGTYFIEAENWAVVLFSVVFALKWNSLKNNRALKVSMFEIFLLQLVL